MSGPPPSEDGQAVAAVAAVAEPPDGDGGDAACKRLRISLEGEEAGGSPNAWAQQTMGRMAPPQDEEDSPTSTAHFPFGLSHDPYDTFVKQQLMLLEDEPLSGQSVKAVRLRSLEVEDSLVQELSEQLRALEAWQCRKDGEDVSVIIQNQFCFSSACTALPVALIQSAPDIVA
ncbi:hypothetical protein AK812_SmicGene26834 [Symbiodinium microadriaticum]|uniref:Uncharacterized protein n=1 Tax=Symbiodinium microadriaticum TaxID=2951 RepID=A0A1Q9D8K9_SYMMI|nr:hypothetical protein AK812_SmicGene26834 [Symbiodinium microadriaticum]